MRTQILGCYVDNLSMAETLARIEELVLSALPHQHVVVNADKVVKAHFDPELRDIVNSCDLINADGMPIVWASWVLGRPLKERVTGVDLFERLVEKCADKQWGIYLLGAKADVVQRVASVLQDRYPKLRIVGYRDGYWTAAEEAAVAAEIEAVRPDVLFVAISSPMKERFLRRHQSQMKVPFAMGVGGTFDVVAGQTKRAPSWMRRLGFEWFYRFLQEPRRMFKRYFIEDMYFFWLLAIEFVRRRDARVVSRSSDRRK